ncbi:glycosyltransferase [Candidatus Dependentiae bacterium]|nr:MAG: glycosyltransferase [Candidatus Dependentiae bacterium]
MQQIAIIIPAYNEEKRLARTIKAYIAFFNSISDIQCSLIIALNGCTDSTKEIVTALQAQHSAVHLIETNEAGKGLAIKNGFTYALEKNRYNYIGFVDADMATEAAHFYELIKNVEPWDGIIASRYMHGARITPQRPFIKRWGSKIIYESLIYMLFGMSYKDYQCGAKLFKTNTIKAIINNLHLKQWAFDVELLYTCKLHKFIIKEYPTIWHDQAGSKLKLTHGIFMLAQLIKLRLQHSSLCSILKTKRNNR